MKSIWRSGCVAGAIALTLLALGGPALAEPEIRISSPNLTLRTVLLSLQGNLQYQFVDPTGKLADRIVPPQNYRARDLEDAVRAVCRSVGLQVTKVDGTLLIHEGPLPGMNTAPPAPAPASQPEPSRTPPQRPAPPAEVIPPEIPDPVDTTVPEPYIIDQIKLDFVDVRDIYRILLTASLDRTYRELRGQYRYLSPDQIEIYPGVVDPTTGAWYHPNSAPPIFSGVVPRFPGGMLGGSTAGNQIAGLGGFGGPYGGVGGPFGGAGGPFGAGGGGFFGPEGPGGGGGLPFGGGGPGGLGTGVGGFGPQGLLPPGIQTVLGYMLDNSLIVRGTPDAIAELKVLLRYLDVPAKQIMIRIEQVAVQSTFRKSFGFDWRIINSDILVQSAVGGSTGGTIDVAIVGNNFRAALAAFESQGRATTIDSVTVTTMNNTQAVFFQSATTTIFLPVLSQIAGAGQVTQFSPVTLPVPTSLFITPRVNGDGTLTLLIPFQISRIIGESVGPQGQRVPNTLTTLLFSIRRVASGQTVVIGGGIQRTDSSSFSSIPILKDLPLIGPLFRSKIRNIDGTETLFFVTPQILGDEQGIGGQPIVPD